MVETHVVHNATTPATVYGRFEVDAPDDFEDDDDWTGFDQCCWCPLECCYAGVVNLVLVSN